MEGIDKSWNEFFLCRLLIVFSLRLIYIIITMEKISISVTIKASKEKVWGSLTTPSRIQKWNHASDDWETTKVKLDFKVGGRFLYHMQAKDLSFGFDFEGTFTEIIPFVSYAYALDDNRQVNIKLEEKEGVTTVVETFDPESENPVELQKTGWLAILTNLKVLIESKR